MHLRETTVKRNGKTYRYAQLVESYRRDKDGMPAHKVIASLGDLPGQTIANIKCALEASKRGKAVVIRGTDAKLFADRSIIANLDYLDVAAALSIWRQWKLPEILRMVMPGNDREICDEDIVAALTVQRCVAPGSKFYAQRWFPTTALPELLGISPGQFNNTRIHRVLDALEKGEKILQERLSRLYHVCDGAFVSLFLDVSDTWFTGHGPELAQKGKTKEGMTKRKVGIVLLCNEKGYPLRWNVVSGKSYDAHVMQDAIDSFKELDWAQNIPLVCDRIMGKKTAFTKVIESGLHFVTAIPDNEIEAYTDKVPHNRFANIDLALREETRQEDLRRVVRTAMDAGMKKASEEESLYVIDLGIIKRVSNDKFDPYYELKYVWEQKDRPLGVAALLDAQEMKKDITSDKTMTYTGLMRKYGISNYSVYSRLRLSRLSPDIQEAILTGYGSNVPIRELEKLSIIRNPQQQREKFDELVKKAENAFTRMTSEQAVPGRRPTDLKDEPICFRGVVTFNPELFLDQRRLAEERLQSFYSCVRAYNMRLRSSCGRRKKTAVIGEVFRLLKSFDLRDVFDVVVHEKTEGTTNMRFEVEVIFKRNEWYKRRRYDGFSLIAAHPELPHNAMELVKLYRSKDSVEKDFQLIKSILKLRPVRHRTNPKVRAHVTICMLALLLERTLESHLSSSSSRVSANTALEILSTCHLNQLQPLTGIEPIYTITRCNEEQKALLRALNLAHLADDMKIMEIITPR